MKTRSLPGRVQRLFLILALLIILLLLTVAGADAAPRERPTASGGFYHTVHYGETLSEIAVHYGTTMQAIMAANPYITHPNLIYAGLSLYIPAGSGYHWTPGPGYNYYCRLHHYVQWGENLSGIARYYGLSPWTVAEANSIYNLNHIYAGQYLCIP